MLKTNLKLFSSTKYIGAVSDVNFGNAVYMIDRCTLQNQFDGSAYISYEMWILYDALNRHGWKTIVIQYWY